MRCGLSGRDAPFTAAYAAGLNTGHYGAMPMPWKDEPMPSPATDLAHPAALPPARSGRALSLPVVLVLQGGGALGAYQGGVYEALHEAGIEPDWVIGTSIGAINAALIAGNRPAQRLDRLREFWQQVAFHGPRLPWLAAAGQHQAWNRAAAIVQGVPGFFSPNPPAWLGPLWPLDEQAAGYYLNDELQRTLSKLTDARLLAARSPRLTVGAVRVDSGQMHYFDSRDAPVDLAQVMASGALPPAFAPVRVGDALYWDGGIYSNTPVEVVFDDQPRRSALVFSVQLWRPAGAPPRNMAEVATRQQDIQFASRADSHLRRQAQLHHLRHIVRELARALPAAKRALPQMQDLAAHGCGTVMHLMNLVAPRLPDEDASKDLDFNADRIQARWQAGLEDMRRTLRRRAWDDPFDAMLGLVVHDGPGQTCSTLTPNRLHTGDSD